MFIAVILGLIVVLFFEYRSLMKQHQYREIAFSASFLVIAFSIGVLTYYKVPIPSPLRVINTIFEPISRYVTQLLAE